MSLKRDVRKAIERGSSTYGIVEEINANLVTVTVIGTGSRVTSLEYLGSVAPKVGDLVILDYSAGPKPFVRLVGNQAVFPEDPSMFVEEPNIPGPQDNDGIYGGLDVGMGCTTKAFSNSFPNEPHEQGEPWLQYWGFNLNDTWISALYDTDEIYGDLIYTGPQYFNINLNGKYLIALHTAPHLAGSSYGASPYGILRARVLRYYAGEEYPIMIGIATASGYNDYYYMDIAKQVYLAEGDVISVEFMYTGEVHGYKQSLSSNPLEWLTTGNEFVFKIQLLTEATVSEPPPEIEVYDNLVMVPDMVQVNYDATVEDINSLNVNVIDVSDDLPSNHSNFGADIGAVHDQTYYFGVGYNDGAVSYDKIWRMDSEGNILTADAGHAITRFGLAGPNKFAFLERWEDSNYIYTKLRIMDWNTQSISTIDDWQEEKNPDYSFLKWTVADLEGTFVYEDTHYAILSRFSRKYDVDFGYTTIRTVRFLIYNIDDGTWSTLDDDVSSDGYADPGYWYARGARIGSEVFFPVEFDSFNNYHEGYIIDLSTMSLSSAPTPSFDSQTYFENTVPHRGENRFYFAVNHPVNADMQGIGYYDLDTNSWGYPGASEDYYRMDLAHDGKNAVYHSHEDSDTQVDHPDWYDHVISDDRIDLESPDHVISFQVDSETGRMWRLQVGSSAALKGYHETESSRSISLAGTPLASLSTDSRYLYSGYMHIYRGEFMVILEQRDTDPDPDTYTYFAYIIRK